MESDFEKKLHSVQPRKLSGEERSYLWSIIQDGIAVEKDIDAYKKSNHRGFNPFNIFKNFKRTRFIVAGIITGALVSGSFATLAYADHSRPGDPLFPLDLATENIRLRIAATDHRDDLQIEFASERLEEVKELLALAGVNFDVVNTESNIESQLALHAATSSGNTATSTTVTSTTTQSSDTGTTTSTTTENTNTGTNTNTNSSSQNTNVSATTVTQTNNAFLIALDYLKDTRATFLANGNDVGVVAIDAFISELTILAEHHVNDIEKVRIVVNNGDDDKERVSINIKASVDDVKTKFNFTEMTKDNGETTHKIVLENGTTSSKLRVNENQTVYSVDNEKNKKNKRSEDVRKLTICYKGNTKVVTSYELSSYVRKGATVGECWHDDDDGDDEDDDDHDNDKKITICHKNNTITISKSALSAHLNHGDTTGKCGDHDDGDRTPPVISGISVNATTTSATITWNTNEKATSTIWYDTENDVLVIPGTPHSDDTTFRKEHSMTVTGLTASTTYYFVITNGDMSGNVATSTESSFTTASSVPDADTTPPFITGVVVNATTTSAQVAWHTNEQTTGVVWYGTTTPLVVDGTTVGAISGTLSGTHSATATPLVSDTRYYYIIVATDVAGNTSTTTQDSFMTTPVPVVDETAPVISNLIKEATTTEAIITFTTNESAKSTLWYSTIHPVPIGALSLTFPPSGATTTHAFTLSPLVPETTYYFLIEVEDASGNSALSSENSVTTTPLPDVAAPTISGITTEHTATSTNVSFATNEPAGSKIWYGTTTPLVLSGDTLSLTHSPLVTSHLFELLDLVASTTYYFAIEATDAASNTGSAGESSFTTP